MNKNTSSDGDTGGGYPAHQEEWWQPPPPPQPNQQLNNHHHNHMNHHHHHHPTPPPPPPPPPQQQSHHHHFPQSTDACSNIVHSLLNHSCGEHDFSRRAIESLVKKMKEKRDELDALITAITTSGAVPTPCVTIQRTLDGRLQVAGRKGFPHVIYAKIWRWPDLTRNELRPTKNCAHAFNHKSDLICVNPYHYDRVVVSPGIDLSSLTINSPDDLVNGLIDPHSRSPTMIGNLLVNNNSINPGPANIVVSNDLNSIPSNLTPLVNNASPNRTLNLEPLQHHQQIPVHQYHHYPSTNTSSLPHTPQQIQSADSIQPLSQSNLTAICPVDTVVSDVATVPGARLNQETGGLNENSGAQQQELSVQPVETVPPCSSQPPPEYWCSIAYFELDQQVGETFRVSHIYPGVTIDGYTNPSAADRFCIGFLSNVHRPANVQKARLHIGKGIRLETKYEGDVWLENLSDNAVFLCSPYLDQLSRRTVGNAVHKIYPRASLKVFDLKTTHRLLSQKAEAARQAAAAQAAAVAGTANINLDNHDQLAAAAIGVDDLRRYCILSMSFVKGWGLDYPRSSIKNCPCWIEVHLHRALQLLDEVLQLKL